MKNVLANRNERAFYKMVVNADTNYVVGIHMMADDAGDPPGRRAIAVKAGLTASRPSTTRWRCIPSMAEELVLVR